MSSDGGGRSKSSTNNAPAPPQKSAHHHRHNKNAANKPSNKQLFAVHGGGNAEKRQIVGQYMLGKTIGEGTFGKVKLAVHIPTGEKVAVKILEKSRIKEAADVRRVNREIKILKKARHGNVIQLYEVLDTQHTIYLIMECCEGGEMFDFIVAQKHVAEPQACKFFHQLVDGVDVLHKNEITHRDLKPENLLLKSSPDGWIVKIVDFGLSNTHDGGKFLSTACGSPCYAAPEMIAGKKYFGPLADIWSMGVILFALVCGYLPFEDANTSVLYRKIMSGEYRPARWISNDARDLLRKILEVDPTKRYTLEDIRKHPWYTQIRESDIPKECINPYEDDTTRNETLAVLQASGVDTQAVMDGLASKACNSMTAMYFLFEQKHRSQRVKNMSNQQQKSRAEMVQNKSDGVGLALPSTVPRGHGVTGPATTFEAAGVPIIAPGNHVVKPSPLFQVPLVMGVMPTASTSTSPVNASTANAPNAVGPPAEKSGVKMNIVLAPLPGLKTPYLQTPSILSPKANSSAAAPSALPVDYTVKNGVPLPAGASHALDLEARSASRPEVPKLAVRAVQPQNHVLISQTARAAGAAPLVTPLVAMPQTARAATGATEESHEPPIRRSFRVPEPDGTGAVQPSAPAQPMPSHGVRPLVSTQLAAAAGVTSQGPVVPAAPSAPSGSAPSGGRRGRNIVAHNAEVSISNGENGEALVGVESTQDARNDSERNQLLAQQGSPAIIA